jgi:hypothetical protein
LSPLSPSLSLFSFGFIALWRLRTDLSKFKYPLN